MAAGAVEVNVTTNNSRGCAMFDGVDDYVEVAHNANQLGANLSNGFTISAWIMPRTSGEGDTGSYNNGRILDKTASTTSGDGFYYQISQTNPIVLFRMSGGTQRGTGVLSFNVWTHVLVVVTNDLVTHYVNGVVSGIPAAAGDIATITTTNAPRIGNRSAGTDRTFDGGIAQVKMWNRVLTSAEITADYQGTSPQSGLILDVPLQDDYTDNKGNAVTNSGSYLSIVDDAISAAIKADRTTANDKYLMVGMPGGQVVSAIIEEAP